MPQRSIPQRVWYRFIRFSSQMAGIGLLRLRAWGRDNVPASGGAMILSTHQSHFDPVRIGVTNQRPLNYMARKTLFAFAPLKWLIVSLDAIPIDRDGLGLSGLKETLRRLKNDEIVLIFPEGTRSHDGRMAPLKPGFSALAKRANVPLVPAAIVGAFEAWPRTRSLPGRSTVHIVYGPPLMPDEALRLGDRELVDEIERRMLACAERASQFRRHALND